MTRYLNTKTGVTYRNKGDFILFCNAQIIKYTCLYEKVDKLYNCMNILNGLAYYADPSVTDDEKKKLEEAYKIVSEVCDSVSERKNAIFDDFVDKDWQNRIQDGTIVEMEEEE